MALGALTLSVTQGVQGRPFQAKINGLTTGRVEVLSGTDAGAPGFSTVNGNVMSSGLPYPVSTVALVEYDPGATPSFRISRIDIAAATRAQLRADAIASLDPGAKLRRFTAAGNVQPDGSIVYTNYVEDDSGATKQIEVTAAFPSAYIGDTLISFGLEKVAPNYNGPVARLTKSADLAQTTLIYDAAELDALTLSGWDRVYSQFDQRSGYEMLWSGGLPGIGKFAGKWAPRARVTGHKLSPSPAHRAALANTPGLTINAVAGGLPPGDGYAAPQYLFYVSRTDNAVVPRQFLRIGTAASAPSRGGLDTGGLRLDADANQTINTGKAGTVVIASAVYDFTEASVHVYQHQAYQKRYQPFQTAGNSGSGTPLDAYFSIPFDNGVGGYLFEAHVKAAPTSEDRLRRLDTDQRSRYSALRQTQTYVGDGIASWWTGPKSIIRNNILTMVYVKQGGGQAVAQFDVSGPTPFLLDERILSSLIYPGDDHNPPVLSFLDDGALIIVATGHGFLVNGIGGEDLATKDHTYRVWRSETGLIADLKYLGTIPNTVGKSNYGHLTVAGGRVWYNTNDDDRVSWLPFTSDDRCETWTQRRELLRMGTAMGGSQQLYCAPARIGTNWRTFWVPHPTNLRNPIKVTTLDLATGDHISGAGVLDNTLTTTGGTVSDFTAASTIYTPAAGKSCRLLDVSADGTMLLIMVCDNNGLNQPTSLTNQEYRLLRYVGTGSIYNAANWTETVVRASVGVFMWPNSGYTQGGCIARDYVGQGAKVYYAREAAGTCYLCEAVSTDFTNWTETVLESGAAFYPRPDSPIGATTKTPFTFSRAPTYTHFLNWVASRRIWTR